MGRGGAAKTREEPERRCVATGQTGECDGLIRFVLDPEGVVTPDLAERLPGRGVWVSADCSALEKAAKKNLFAKSLRSPATVPQDLAGMLERLLTRRAIESLGLCRKAGQAVGGFEKAREALTMRDPAALVQACDGSMDGRKKLGRLAKGITEITCLTKSELGLAFGRASVIHVVLLVGGAANRAIRECARLQGFRPAEIMDGDGPAPAQTSSGRRERDAEGDRRT